MPQLFAALVIVAIASVAVNAAVASGRRRLASGGVRHDPAHGLRGISIPALLRRRPDDDRPRKCRFPGFRRQFVSLVGPSGCGKSTLLFQVAGLRQPTSGIIRCNGESITAPMPQKIGMIFQEANLLPWLTAVENVAFPLKLRGVAKRERIETATRMLPVDGLTGFETGCHTSCPAE